MLTHLELALDQYPHGGGVLGVTEYTAAAVLALAGPDKGRAIAVRRGMDVVLDAQACFPTHRPPAPPAPPLGLRCKPRAGGTRSQSHCTLDGAHDPHSHARTHARTIHTRTHDPHSHAKIIVLPAAMAEPDASSAMRYGRQFNNMTAQSTATKKIFQLRQHSSRTGMPVLDLAEPRTRTGILRTSASSRTGTKKSPY
jgi:hypothetical protein